MPCTDSCPAPRLSSAVALCGVLGRGPGGSHAPCRLTQELLQHLAVVKVLLQLLHDDSLLHQDVVDPVSEHLGETQASQPRPPRQGTRAGAGTKLPAARGPGQAGPEGQASPSPPNPARQGILWEFMLLPTEVQPLPRLGLPLAGTQGSRGTLSQRKWGCLVGGSRSNCRQHCPSRPKAVQACLSPGLP